MTYCPLRYTVEFYKPQRGENCNLNDDWSLESTRTTVFSPLVGTQNTIRNLSYSTVSLNEWGSDESTRRDLDQNQLNLGFFRYNQWRSDPKRAWWSQQESAADCLFSLCQRPRLECGGHSDDSVADLQQSLEACWTTHKSIDRKKE